MVSDVLAQDFQGFAEDEEAAELTRARLRWQAPDLGVDDSDVALLLEVVPEE